MQPWHTFLLALAAAVVLADLFAVSECSPGHMNIPYYQKRKEEAQHREMAELARECRNSRNMDPKCAQVRERAWVKKKRDTTKKRVLESKKRHTM